MFQNYKKMFLSATRLFAIENGGGSPEERQEASDLKAKIEAAKLALTKMGRNLEVTQLEEAVKGIKDTAREEAGELLLAKVVENFMTSNADMRN
jgi:hypothetical protein